ncbi:MAG: TylF/MycF/NovP-related O-methyltransferase [Nitrospirales bacterium]
MTSGIDRLGALDKAFEFIYKSETDGDYCEFGVYQGVSLLRALQADYKWRKQTNRRHVKRFFGFDSFQGLPPFQHGDQLDGYGVFKEGQFDDTSVEMVLRRISEGGFNPDKIKLVSGLFSDTLKSASVVEYFSDSLVSIAHIDCDLYSSALDCLTFLDGRLAEGTILLFDDWFCFRGHRRYGVRAAFELWSRGNKYCVTEYFSYSWAGKAFIVNINDV